VPFELRSGNAQNHSAVAQIGSSSILVKVTLNGIKFVFEAI